MPLPLWWAREEAKDICDEKAIKVNSREQTGRGDGPGRGSPWIEEKTFQTWNKW